MGLGRGRGAGYALWAQTHTAAGISPLALLLQALAALGPLPSQNNQNFPHLPLIRAKGQVPSCVHVNASTPGRPQLRIQPETTSSQLIGNTRLSFCITRNPELLGQGRLGQHAQGASWCVHVESDCCFQTAGHDYRFQARISN